MPCTLRRKNCRTSGFIVIGASCMLLDGEVADLLLDLDFFDRVVFAAAFDKGCSKWLVFGPAVAGLAVLETTAPCYRLIVLLELFGPPPDTWLKNAS